MYKILLIDKGRPSIQSFQKILKRKNFSLIKALSLKEAIRTLNKNKVDLIVVNKVFSSSSVDYKKFKDITADIPKLLVIHDHSLKGLSVWLRDRSVTPVYEPASSREFEYWVKRLLRDKAIITEKQELQATLKTKKKELGFLENITKVLASSLKLTKILASIMKRTQAMIGAEAWSILIVDEEKEELFFEKIPGKKSKGKSYAVTGNLGCFSGLRKRTELQRRNCGISWNGNCE